ncbi:MAG: ABC transporter substrate-binding protein [Bilophila wadsworthia]
MKGLTPTAGSVRQSRIRAREDLHRPQGHVRSLHVEPLAARPGLNERDVNIVDMQPSEAMKAFADGQGDAIALWAPDLEAKVGLKTVAHSSDCNARQPILLVANMDYANKHKGDIVAFLRGISAAWT